MPRQLVLFGSGETTPAMVTFHRELFARHGALDPSTAVMLDTTFGFQTNADDLTARLQAYFEESTGTTVGAVRLRSSSESAATVAAALDAVTSASWVFAGPGSPTYTARNWLAVGMERAFVRVLASLRSEAGRTLVRNTSAWSASRTSASRPAGRGEA